MRSMSTNRDVWVDGLVARMATVRHAEVRDSPVDKMGAALYDALVSEGTGLRASVPVIERRSRLRRIVLVASAAAILLLAGVVLGSLSSSVGPSGTASALVPLRSASGVALTGKIPNSAIHDGRIQWSKVSGYVAAFSGGRFVGYVNKADLSRGQPAIAEPQIRPIWPRGVNVCFFPSPGSVDVYNKSLNLIGHIDPMIGFVPLGKPTCGTASG